MSPKRLENRSKRKYVLGYKDGGALMLTRDPSMTLLRALATQKKYWGMTVYELVPVKRGSSCKGTGVAYANDPPTGHACEDCEGKG